MGRLFTTFLYGLASYFILITVSTLIGLSGWWVDIILIVFSYFIGSFIYNYRHGAQVLNLTHLDSNGIKHKFRVDLLLKGHAPIIAIGEYERAEAYPNSLLQSQIFRSLNSFPGSTWFKEFADEGEDELSITVNDFDSPPPLNFTQVTLRKEPLVT